MVHIGIWGLCGDGVATSTRPTDNLTTNSGRAIVSVRLSIYYERINR